MRPVVLTLAGSDSSAGAGVQADLRTLQTLGCFGASVVTAVTAQNTRKVVDWQPVDAKLIVAQARAVLEDLPVAALKTGLLGGAETVEAVASAVYASNLPLVVDPVVGSTSGARFLDRRGRAALKDLLLPRATLVTPNLPEAEVLTGVAIANESDRLRAAEKLLSTGAYAVLIKGGHGRGPLLTDLLVTSDGVRTQWGASRIRTKNTHGTGCVLSAAIAAGLARQLALVVAVEQARRFLQTALASGAGDRWGGGAGPAFSGW